MNPIEVIVDEYWLTLIVGVLLPGVTALVTHRLAHAGVKALVLLFLSVLGGWLTQLQQEGGHFEVWSTIANILLAFATAVIAHYGILKPINLTGSTGIIQRGIPAGVGGRHVDPNSPGTS